MSVQYGGGNTTFNLGAGHLIDNTFGTLIYGGVDMSNPYATIRVNGTGKADFLGGTALNDIMNGNGGNDLIVGQKGNDTLNGGSGNDKLRGNDGNDILWGDAGADNLYGNTGDDRFRMASGDDAWGGADRDTFIFADKTTNVRVHNFNANDDTLDFSGEHYFKIDVVAQSGFAVRQVSAGWQVGSGTLTLSDGDSRVVVEIESTRLFNNRGYAEHAADNPMERMPNGDLWLDVA
jgi:Ca2+-binding RTX toxin-like protein